MLLPVGSVHLRLIPASDGRQVSGILFLGGLSEVERSRNHRGPVDDHNLVVGNGMFVVDIGRDAGVGQASGRCVPF